jgi:hypothetical protein
MKCGAKSEYESVLRPAGRPLTPKRRTSESPWKPAAERGLRALHAAINGLFPSGSGNMHIKVSPNWDLATAIRFTNGDLGYKGLYSLEVDPSRIRSVMDTILASI